MSSAKAGKYAAAGVDLDKSNDAKSRIGRAVAKTHTPRVLHREGAFGGLFDIASLGVEDPVLCSSVDGVGTKLELAYATGRHAETAADIVYHCVDDILVLGAEPLFFLDYIGIDAMEPDVIEGIVTGLSEACEKVGCALIGGETAALPGLYPLGKYDLAGCMVGLVSKKRIIDGSTIAPGDVILGLPAWGLHTNGYTLARKVFFPDGDYSRNEKVPGTGESVMDALLKSHRPYLAEIRALREQVTIKGMCHITGGGFEGNLSRVLPAGTKGVVDTTAWEPLPVFKELAKRGDVSQDEMYRVFNMGMGYLVMVSADEAAKACDVLPELVRVGEIAEGEGVTLRFQEA